MSTSSKSLSSQSSESVVPYLVTYAALMGLLAATFLLSHLPKVGSLHLVVALLISTVKAVIVLIWFMHLRHSSRTAVLFFAASFYMLLIAFLLMLPDYLTR